MKKDITTSQCTFKQQHIQSSLKIGRDIALMTSGDIGRYIEHYISLINRNNAQHKAEVEHT